MMGRLRPNSSWDACRPDRGNLFGRFHISRHDVSSLESMEAMAFGDNAIRQRVCINFEISSVLE
jgi:hypothetical protein